MRFTRLQKLVATVMFLIMVSCVPAYAYDTTYGVFITSSGSTKYYTGLYEDATRPLLTPSGTVHWVNENGILYKSWWKYGQTMEDPSIQKWYYIDNTGKCIKDQLKIIGGTWYYFSGFYMVDSVGFTTVPEYDKLIYVASESGDCYTGLHIIDGYTYYFGSVVSSDFYTMPLAAKEELIQCSDGIWRAFDKESHMIDTTNVTQPTLIQLSDGKTCIATGSNTFSINEDIQIGNIIYTTDTAGYVYLTQNINTRIATSSNANK